MTKQSRLAQILAGEKFEKIESIFKEHFALPLEITDSRGAAIEHICSPDHSPRFCQLIRQSDIGSKRCSKQRMQSLGIASETGQSHITVCHAGIVLAAVPAVDDKSVMGGIFFGKCLWEPLTPALISDIKKRLKDVPVDIDQLIASLHHLPVIQGKKIQTAAQFLFDLLYEISGIESRTIRLRTQPEISNIDLAALSLTPAWAGPTTDQVELAAKLRIGDTQTARQILDSAAGKILIHHTEGLDSLKARFLEMLGFLDRTALQCGVLPDLIMQKHTAAIENLKKIDSKPNLCNWIDAIFQDFMNTVYKSKQLKKVVQIRPAINFIDANFDKEITVAQVAHVCHLSSSRLAHIFTEYMGITIIDYLNSVRLEKAKNLLLKTDRTVSEICSIVGFNNQSYFIRAFKSCLGTTPAKFRANNRSTVF